MWTRSARLESRHRLGPRGASATATRMRRNPGNRGNFHSTPHALPANQIGIEAKDVRISLRSTMVVISRGH